MFLNAGAERHHYFREVSLGRFVYLSCIRYIQVCSSQMRAKKVAGKQHLIFPQICKHSLGPVYPGGMDELQGFVPRGQGFAVVYGDEFVLSDKQKGCE